MNKQQEKYAIMVEAMLNQKPWCDHLMARGAIIMAARAIRRGRHLTATEKIDNLLKLIKEE